VTASYVIRRAFKDYTPQEFHSYVTGLYKAPDVIPDAKGAPGIRITKGKKALVIKCTREGKQVTTAELVALALEYQLDQETLRTALTKRKFQIVNEEGEVTNLNAAARQKLAALVEVLRATDRDSVYEIKVIAVPQAAIALHARAIILISEPALDAHELQSLVAHEVGHEYVWAKRERSFRLADRSRLKDLELMCDAIAIVTLHGLGMDVSRLMTGVQKISRFNRERFGTADNEKDYPTVAERRAFTGAVATWIARTGAR